MLSQKDKNLETLKNIYRISGKSNFKAARCIPIKL
jgi:hypothetical protein